LSESNRRKTEFLATLAHELRNPLAPIRTGLDLLRISDKSPSASANVLGMMDRQLDQMVHLINDLMDVSRINSGKIVLKKECTDLRAALTSAVESVIPAIEASQHKLDVQVPSKPIMLEADPIRLAQIMANLLTNAGKYTPNGGHIALSAKQENEEVIITVTDSGMGIPEEELSGLFEMFSQVSRNMGRSQGGLGIGLSLVKSLVEMHGGTVMASSQGVGKGSTFTVRLPLTKDCGSQKYSSDKDAAEAVVAQKDHLNILIADDNQDAAMTLAYLLQTLGHATVVVHDGMQAVRRAKLLRPNLVILDIGMPVLNGYEAASEMRRSSGLEDIVLVALTGWGSEEDRRRAKESGFDAHLVQPVGMVEIKQLLSNLKEKSGNQS
jgi:CheY-like chemotaxis protein